MSEWLWFQEYEQEAQARGDRDRARLGQIHRDAYTYRETDPDRMLALLAEGRQLAQQLGEPWWVLLYDHWKVHTLIYHKCDYREVLEPAVRNLLTVRKLANAEFPQRLRICSDVVMAYLQIDPLGYAGEIVEALTYFKTELTPEMDSSPYLLLECERAFAFEERRWDDALRIALDCLARADADPDRYTARHHSVGTYSFLCQLAFERHDWPGLRGWAAAGEELARQMGYLHPLARFVLWQALVAEHDGDRVQAGRLCLNAISRMSRLGKKPSEDYFHALAAYHEMRGNSAEALRVRDAEWQTIADRGRLAYECEVLIERCRLLARMGQLEPTHREAARQAAGKLRRPERYLVDIDAITPGR